MQGAVQPARLIRFATFEADLDSGELRRNGLKLKLSGQPFQVLAILLERPGTVVTREELQQRLWPDSFVDFDHNLNAAINRIREVLGDSAENPRFIQTIPKRGYRFIAPVTASSGLVEEPPVPSKTQKNRMHLRWAMVSFLALAVGLLAALWMRSTRPAGSPQVVRFTPLTGDGQKKTGPLVTDGVRVYFNEWLPDGRVIIVQVSLKGGEVIPLPVALKAPFIQDISKDGTELLVANDEGAQGRSLGAAHRRRVAASGGNSTHKLGTLRVGTLGVRARLRGVCSGCNPHPLQPGA